MSKVIRLNSPIFELFDSTVSDRYVELILSRFITRAVFSLFWSFIESTRSNKNVSEISLPDTQKKWLVYQTDLDRYQYHLGMKIDNKILIVLLEAFTIECFIMLLQVVTVTFSTSESDLNLFARIPLIWEWWYEPYILIFLHLSSVQSLCTCIIWHTLKSTSPS